jgi:hypothetical protein
MRTTNDWNRLLGIYINRTKETGKIKIHKLGGKFGV